MGARKIKTLISQSHELTLQAFRLFPVFFLGIFVAQFLIKLFIEWGMEVLSHSMQGPWMIQVMGGMTNLIMGFVLLMGYGLALQNLSGQKPLSVSQFLHNTLAPLASEGLLALSRVILGTILFIIPGIVFYVFYTFIPYIIFYDPNYSSGNVSALKESKRLVKPFFFRVSGLLILMGVLSLILELAPNILGLIQWWQEFFFFIAAFYFAGFSFMFFYGLYKNLFKKLASEAL